jgi:hypothetical protein
VLLRKLLIIVFMQTIMMSDPASGSSVEGMINSILSECVWGSFPSGNDDFKLLPHVWKMHSPVPTASPPVEGLISFGEFIENKTNLSRSERKALKTTFTNNECIGSCCREHFELLLDKMKSPSSDFHGDGFYLIMPAFFRFLSVLAERDLDFRLVFRTFGHDIDSVVSEYNMFCSNTHPLFQCDKMTSIKAVDLNKGRGKLIRTADDAAQLIMLTPQSDDVSSPQIFDLMPRCNQ